MRRAVAETTATASSSQPRAAGGWGATSKSAVNTEVRNSTRVCAARELRLRDAASTSLLTETATNSRTVSAPATAASASPKPSHIPAAYPTRATSQIFRCTDELIQSTTCGRRRRYVRLRRAVSRHSPLTAVSQTGRAASDSGGRPGHPANPDLRLADSGGLTGQAALIYGSEGPPGVLAAYLRTPEPLLS